MYTYIVIPENTNKFTNFKAFSTFKAAKSFVISRIEEQGGTVVGELPESVIYLDTYFAEYTLGDTKQVQIQRVMINSTQITPK